MNRTIVLILIGFAVVILTQIASTIYLSRANRDNEVFVDHVQQMLYDGAVVRIEFGRGRVANPESRDPGPTLNSTVARIVITPDGAEQLFQNLAKLRETASHTVKRSR